MATIIRHGPAGSYKSSYAVWFELLPALREGRTVITNVEGMRTIDIIEKEMGERFPLSARIFRVSSQTTKGKLLWQNWYNWCPLGSFILIDEVQDIFNKTQGFNADKNIYSGIDKYKDLLPESFLDYYYRVLEQFKPTEVFTDDIGENIIDENGNVIMPADFRESFQRHRKYNWDLVLCTPNIKALGDDVKSVSEAAIAHKSRDGILPWSKRKTRLFEHDPRSTSVKPSKDDSVTVEKIPVEVHLLYKSTATGLATKAGRGRPIWKEPKLLGALLALAVGFSTFINGLTGMTNDTENNINQLQTEEIVSPSSEANQKIKSTNSEVKQIIEKTSSDSNKIYDNSVLSTMGTSLNVDNNVKINYPISSKSVYVSAVVTKFDGLFSFYDITFEFNDFNNNIHYLDSSSLEKLGYNFAYVDDCLILVTFDNINDYVTCKTHLDNFGNSQNQKSEQFALIENEQLNIF